MHRRIPSIPDLPVPRFRSHHRCLLCVIRLPRLAHAPFARDVAFIVGLDAPFLRRWIVYRRLRPSPPDFDGLARAA